MRLELAACSCARGGSRVASRFVLRFVLGFDTKLLREGPTLLRFHFCRLEDNVSAHHAEGDLAENEPRHIDSLGKLGINSAQGGKDQSGPNQRSRDATP